jgi:UDP-N-acetylmuramyl tripeptide synthase
MGVFEVDEGHLLPAIEAVQPRLVVITNLLRDQLDRYFEIDWVAQLWRQALAKLPPSSTVVLNADDPQVAHLGEGLPNPVIYYGVEDDGVGQTVLEHTSDSRRCLRCGVDLDYDRVYYAHLGHYRCPGCGWGRPTPAVAARAIALRGMDGSALRVSGPSGDVELELPLGGLHNAYNALVAVAAATALDVDAGPVRDAVAAARSPFGRLERFSLDGHDVVLALVKNPSGYNETLRLVTSDERPKGLMLAINDQIQDGRDVSWIWDVDFERCRDGVEFVVCAGRRAHDMSVRLKYAGLFERPGGPELIIEQDVLRAFDRALARAPDGGPLFVLPTYTAMWTLRETLARAGHLEPFWRS